MGTSDESQRPDDASAIEIAEDLVPTGNDFDCTQAQWGPLYPSPEILAELGRVTIAAARVDRQLALVLLAIKYSSDFDRLLKMSSGELCKVLVARLPDLFEGDLLASTLANLAEVRKRIEVRHAVAHSIWSPADRSEFVRIEVLAGLGSQEELDTLLFQRGADADWQTLHPKTNAPGPQTMDELQTARKDLETAADWLENCDSRSRARCSQGHRPVLAASSIPEASPRNPRSVARPVAPQTSDSDRGAQQARRGREQPS